VIATYSNGLLQKRKPAVHIGCLFSDVVDVGRLSFVMAIRIDNSSPKVHRESAIGRSRKA
jgi:hypothetical protein